MDVSKQLKQQLTYIQNQRRQIEDLRGKVERLEELLFLTCADGSMKWLFENRSERMDPTVPIFDRGRADFHWDRYRFASERIAGKRVLDAACGTGYGSRLMKEQGAAEVIGVDVSDEAIAYANDRHRIEGVKFLVNDATNTCFNDANFDVVVSFETVEHVPDDLALLKEFQRVLKPGGELICSTPNQWPLEIAPHHVKEYDLTEFQNVLGQFFNVVEMYNQNSGTSFQYNREQPRGIVATTDTNQQLAECFLAVAVR